MSWFKKEEKDLPKSFQGKTPEQIEQELQQAETLRSENERLKQGATAQTQMQTELEQAKARLRQLEGNNRQEQPPKEAASVFTDEEAAFQERLGPLAVANMQTAARLSRMGAEQAIAQDKYLGPIFRKYNKEYLELVAQLTLQQAMNEAAYGNLVSIIAGRHMEEIMTESRKANNEFFTEGSGSGAPPKSTKKDGELDDAEKAMAKRMGLTEEQYAKAKGDIQFTMPIGA